MKFAIKLSLASVLILTICACACASGVLRMGFPEFPGEIETDAYGRERGYGYEYFEELARYAGWYNEYVQMPFDMCFPSLMSGDIDMFGPIIKNDEREKFFDFAALPFSINHSMLCVRSDDSRYMYDDFAAFNGMTVGMLNDSSVNADFDRFCAKHGFSVKKKQFGRVIDLMRAFNSGDIDGLAVTSLLRVGEKKVVARFSPHPHYFAVRRGNTELLDRLDSAMARMRLLDPRYEEQLFNRYYSYSTFGVPVFTRGEAAALSLRRKLRAVYVNNWAPFSYENDGEFSGILADIFARISADTGIVFDFIGAESQSDAVKRLTNGDADVICAFDCDRTLAGELGIKLTTPTIDMPIVAVVDDVKLSDNDELLKKVVGFGLFEYNDMERAFESENALNGGVIANAYMANFKIARPLFANYTALSLSDRTHSVAIGVSDRLPDTMVSAFDKVLNGISKAEMNNIVVTNCSVGRIVMPSEITYKYPIELCLLFIAFSLVFFFFRYKLANLRFTNTREVEKILYCDNLTGAWNIDKFQSESEELIKKDDNGKFAVIVVDVNNFKFVNEAYGRDRGDSLLKGIADVLGEFSYKRRYFGRVMSDRFTAVLRNVKSGVVDSRMAVLAQRLTDLSSITGDNLPIVFSLGVFVLPEKFSTTAMAIPHITMAIDRATYAMIQGKKSLKTSFVFFNKNMMDRNEEESELLNSAHDALALGEFIPYYQPKIDISTGKVVGAEVMVYWDKPMLGILEPSSFMPLFERNEFIVELDMYLFRLICWAQKKLMILNKGLIPIACNFSRLHFLDSEFPEKLKKIVDFYGVPANLIDIEVTETTAAENFNMMKEILKKLHDMRFSISLDKFGTSSLSLNILYKLHFDTIKIDKKFVQDDSVSRQNKAIIMKSVRNIAEELGMKVLCEGVTTREHEEFAKTLGCRLAQGSYYSEPLQLSDFFEYLANNQDDEASK